jgi:hypothetical protein
MFLVKVIGVAVACIGAYITGDGIGSILEQQNQAFWWWQFIRVLRSSLGMVLVVLGAKLISLN